MTRHNYPTNEFGDATGRNYTYRVHMDAPEWKRMHRLARWDLRWIEVDPKDVYAPFPYTAFRTYDNKGKIIGMDKWLYSPSWESAPFGPGRHESLEMRNANGGGTRLRGSVYVGYDDDFIRFDRCEIDTTVHFTPTELRDILEGKTGEYPEPHGGRPIDRDYAESLIYDELFYATEDAIEEIREAHYEYMSECDHDHAVMFDAPECGATGYIDGYCEDCGHEFEAGMTHHAA